MIEKIFHIAVKTVVEVGGREGIDLSGEIEERA
jgi:hypothetical protein